MLIKKGYKIPLGNLGNIPILQDQLTRLQKELSSAKDECQSLESRLSQETSSMETKIKRLEEEIEKKESKIKSRSTTITDLMSKIELERNSYEISLQGRNYTTAY